MPVDRTHKRKKNNLHICDHPDCSKPFARSYDLQRHKVIHCDYKDRLFPCPISGCDFRANQQANLKCHVNSIHKKERLACGYPGCHKSFSDPSSRCKHRQNFHNLPARSKSDDSLDRGRRRAQLHDRCSASKMPKSKSATPPSSSVDNGNDASSQDSEDILNQFATFALQASQGISPSPTPPPSSPSSSSSSSELYASASLSYDDSLFSLLRDRYYTSL